jgi:phosphoribosylaminoimidazolecarboxamide formyltransferase / IMP cyclohydrolase
MDIALKYGCNPHQTPASVTVPEESGFTVLSGRPGYINFLDALGAWQLVRELRAATGKPAAASFKHVSPAGAAVAGELSAAYRASQFLGDEDFSPLATAYARARGGDRMCSFGDAAAVSDVVDMSLARILFDEVSDLIIAPGFEPEALELLRTKRDGAYMVLAIDPGYEPADVETREVFGFTMSQKRNTSRVAPELFQAAGADAAPLPAAVLETLIVATVALKYTQSNSVGVACDGQVIGMGAGQQSRVHCTRLACGKADKWLLQQHPKTLALPIRDDLPKPEKANLVDYYLLWDELSDVEKRKLREGLTADPEPLTRQERADWVKQFDGICLSSDAFIPFPDNLDRAAKSNVQYVAQTGGSARDDVVSAAAAEYGMTMVHTGLRLFLH